MGEVADMMIDGTLCAGCGVFLNEEPPGYPDYCGSCEHDGTKASQMSPRTVLHTKPKKPHSKCSECGRWVKTVGLQDHIRDSHGPMKQVDIQGLYEAVKGKF